MVGGVDHQIGTEHATGGNGALGHGQSERIAVFLGEPVFLGQIIRVALTEDGVQQL